MNNFNDLKISPLLERAIKDLGYEKPTPIQTQTLPILLGEPTDFIGQAATGTGKTAAFAIPLLEKIDVTKKSVQGLVLCPTRELAMQVTDQLNLLGKYKGTKVLAVYGGTPFEEQIRGLRNGVHIVVGTPGRLVDHLERERLKLDWLQVVVLDEADEMISMGFKEELEVILKRTPRESSQIWLFSATMSKEVRRFSNTYLRDIKQVQTNHNEMLSNTVEQVFYPARESDKPEILCKLIEAADEFYGLVFCQTKALVMDLTHYLSHRGYAVDCLHGEKMQKDRERTMQSFRDRKVTLLICTDVASRGLDVKGVTHVINYSIPRELENYIHRIGRTARSGKPGIAMSLVTPSHRGLIPRIEKMTKSRLKEGIIPTRKSIGTKKITKVFLKFQEQKDFARASDLLGAEWTEAIESMPPLEIVSRFITMMSPEIFQNSGPLRSHPESSVPAKRNTKSSKNRFYRSPTRNGQNRGSDPQRQLGGND